jgi:hypothetical protein
MIMTVEIRRWMRHLTPNTGTSAVVPATSDARTSGSRLLEFYESPDVDFGSKVSKAPEYCVYGRG